MTHIRNTIFTCAGIAALIAGAAVPSRAADLAVFVKTLENSGGPLQKGPDGTPINERFSIALRKALTEAAKGRFATENGEARSDAFAIEGNLSQLEGEKPGNEAYLCVVRLFSTARGGRRLVGQWAGTARGLRDLTGNIAREGGTSNLGLAGELASRISVVVGGAASAPASASAAGTLPDVYNTLVKSAGAATRLTADVITDGAGASQQPRNTLNPGEKYRLRVSPQDAGTVYILSLGANGKPSSPYAQTEPLDGAPGRSVTLPPNVPFTAPQTGKVEWLVLLRRKTAGGAALLASPRGAIPLPGATGTPALESADTPQYGTPDLPPYGVPDTITAGAPVAVIGGAVAVAPAPSTQSAAGGKLDAETERILGMMRKDALGTWVALTVRLPVVPGDAGRGVKRAAGTVNTPAGAIKTGN